MGQIGNKPKYESLTPEDIDFLNIINENVTAGNALPFDLPEDSVLRIIIRSLKWFWEWYEYATQEKTLFIPIEEIVSKGKPINGNIDLKMPDGIEAIFDLKQAGGLGIASLPKSLRYPIMSSFATAYNSSTNAMNVGSGSFRDSYRLGTFTMNDVVLSMYEQATYNTLFDRGYRFSFNKNTQILRLMTGNVKNGIAIQCFERLSPQELYGDHVFEEYVTAKVEQALGRIVTTFDFNLPGGIKINYDAIASEGKEKADKIEDEIKAANNTDFIVTR